MKNQPFYELSSVPTALSSYIRSFLCFVQVKHGVGVRGLRAANHNGGKFFLKAFLTESSFGSFKFRQIFGLNDIKIKD